MTALDPDLADPVAAARAFIVEDLLNTPDRWRPIPAGPTWLRKGRRDPEAYERGAQMAREALNREDT